MRRRLLAGIAGDAEVAHVGHGGTLSVEVHPEERGGGRDTQRERLTGKEARLLRIQLDHLQRLTVKLPPPCGRARRTAGLPPASPWEGGGPDTGPDRRGASLDLIAMWHGRPLHLLGRPLVASLLARRQLEALVRYGLIGDEAQQVVDEIEMRAALVVGLDDVPGSLLDVRVGEHLVLGFRVVD